MTYTHTYKIYTDGSTIGNPGPAGVAWSIDDMAFSLLLPEKITNNEAELIAVYEAAIRLPAYSKANIYIDSEVVIKWLTRYIPCPYQWRSLLWEDYHKNHREFMFYLIKGKSDEMSILVDKTAKAAAKAALHRYREAHPPPEIPLLDFIIAGMMYETTK
jgi:ribonuclease HI